LPSPTSRTTSSACTPRPRSRCAALILRSPDGSADIADPHPRDAGPRHEADPAHAIDVEVVRAHAGQSPRHGDTATPSPGSPPGPGRHSNRSLVRVRPGPPPRVWAFDSAGSQPDQPLGARFSQRTARGRRQDDSGDSTARQIRVSGSHSHGSDQSGRRRPAAAANAATSAPDDVLARFPQPGRARAWPDCGGHRSCAAHQGWCP
jgi:hypothetical protein